MRTFTASLILGMLIAALAVSPVEAKSKHGMAGWIQAFRDKQPLSASATVVLPAKPEGAVLRLDPTPQRLPFVADQRWTRRSIGFQYKHRYQFKESDSYDSRPHFRYVYLDGSPTAVPEPSAFLALALPAFGAIVRMRRRAAS